jgi:hypothetical protein
VPFVRQLRGHLRVVVTPTTAALLALVVAVVVVRARNAPIHLDGAPPAPARVVLLDAVRVGLLQASTMAGVAVAAIGSASLSTLLSSRRAEEVAALLEPRAVRRWGLRVGAVLAVVVAAASVIALATYPVAVLQAHRLGRPVELAVGDWGLVAGVAARAPLVVAMLAAVSILVAAALRSTPAVGAAVAVGGTQALLLAQHLLGPLGDRLVPTAWVARWLRLSGQEFGVAYYWTVGTYGGGRAAAGVAIAALAAGAGLAGGLLTGRAGRA